MLPRLTRRRSLAGGLLLLGAIGLGVGIWQQNSPLSLLGIAFWTAALIGIGLRLVQRVNAVLQLSRTNHSDIQQLTTARKEWAQLKGAQRKSLELTRKCLEEVSQVPHRLESKISKQVEEQISKQFGQLLNQLTEQARRLDALHERSTAAEGWHHRHSEQFGDFVGSVAEWLAIAEVEAKQCVAESIAHQASAVDAGVDSLLQRFDQVDGCLSRLDEIPARQAAAVEAGVDSVLQRFDQIDGCLSRLDEIPARQAAAVEAGVDSVLQRFDQIDGCLSRLDEIPARQTAAVEAGVDSVLQRFDEIDSCLIRLDETLPARQAAFIEAGVDSLLQRFDQVDGRLTRVDETSVAHSEGMKSISKTITSLLPTQKAELARSRIESVKQVEAIFQLRAFLATDKPMPLLGGWAMDPVSMLALVQELVAKGPHLVLECGAGASTLWIGKALKRMGMGRLVSLEHLQPYHAATTRALLAADLEDWVDLRLAPLRSHRIGSEKFKWYDLEKIDLPERSVDILVVDGPPKDVGPFARYPALPLLERLLADEAVVILDDANRPDEMEGVARWVREFPGLQELTDLGQRTKMFTYSVSDAAVRSGSVHLKVL